MDIGKRLIALRECCGFTQNGLAERAGVSQTHLRRVELGQADITVGHLQLLCDAMSISMQEFFQGTSDSDEIFTSSAAVILAFPLTFAATFCNATAMAKNPPDVPLPSFPAAVVFTSTLPFA